jgi:hypothetical protein
MSTTIIPTALVLDGRDVSLQIESIAHSGDIRFSFCHEDGNHIFAPFIFTLVYCNRKYTISRFAEVNTRLCDTDDDATILVRDIL